MDDDNDQHATAQRNTSLCHLDDADIDGELRLSEELVALIADAKSRESLNGSPTEEGLSDVRYYAAYAEGESCSLKKSLSFESWEETFASMEACCEVAFGWDHGASIRKCCLTK